MPEAPEFEELMKPSPAEDAVMFFGKYEGKTLGWIAKNNPSYLQWLGTIDLPGDEDFVNAVMEMANVHRT